jgi:hypothetical protein
MPTDGTLLLEHMPKEKQYLVTALSFFFSIGAVLSAVVALLVLPQNSCPSSALVPCEVDVQNQGWKYLLITLGLIVRTQIEASFIPTHREPTHQLLRHPLTFFFLQTLSMFLARMIFFRLYESPRYLVHAGRPDDAVKALQLISRFNGSDISIVLEDVRDHHHCEAPVAAERDFFKFDVPSRANSTTAFAANVIPDGPTDPGTDGSQSSRSVPITHYASMGETPEDAVPSDSPTEPMLKDVTGQSLPRWLRRPLWNWWDRVMMVLTPELLRTTILVWFAWFAMALGPSNQWHSSITF